MKITVFDERKRVC